MHIEPYLAMLRKELKISFMPSNNDNARTVAPYVHHVLTQLLARSTALPGLQAKALEELDGLLDELNAVLRSINGGMVLTGDLTQHIRNNPCYAVAEPVLQRAIRVLIDNPTGTSKKLLQRISAIQLRMQESFQQAVMAENAGDDDEEPVEPPDFTDAKKQALQGWLRRQFPGETRLEVGPIKAIVGGGSKSTSIVELRNTAMLPQYVVVRADTAGGVVESTVIDEYHLLETLYEAGIPVAQPFAMESDPSVLGAPFIVTSRVEGRNIGNVIQIYEPSESFGLSLARAMAKLHGIPPERFGGRVKGATIATRDQVRQDIATMETIWRNSGRPSLTLEMAYGWLKDHMQFAEGRRALNHCDIGCHNMLARDGQVAALLDWETTIIGNPAHDLGYVHTIIVQMMAWEDFLAEYENAGGTIPSKAEMDFYLIWAHLNKIGLICVADSFFNAGMSSAAVYAFGIQHVYPLIERDLGRMLKDVYERY